MAARGGPCFVPGSCREAGQSTRFRALRRRQSPATLGSVRSPAPQQDVRFRKLAFRRAGLVPLRERWRTVPRRFAAKFCRANFLPRFDLYIILVSCNLNRAINLPPIVLRRFVRNRI